MGLALSLSVCRAYNTALIVVKSSLVERILWHHLWVFIPRKYVSRKPFMHM